MNYKTAVEVYSTTDYDQFKKLLGNRDVSTSRLSAIKESILRIGYQPSPILVNEYYEVIDGQGRLAACKSLGIPIYFIIKEGLSIDDCISMNIKMKNWDESDYINCYARRGYQSYIDLEEMIREFPMMNWSQIYDVANQNNSAVKEQMKNGKLEFKSFTYKQYERARWISAMLPYIKVSGLYTNRAVDVLIRLDKYKLVDKNRMLDSMEKYSHLSEFKAYRSADTLRALNEIYNYNRKQKKYFADDYQKIADSKKHKKEAANA